MKLMESFEQKSDLGFLFCFFFQDATVCFIENHREAITIMQTKSPNIYL